MDVSMQEEDLCQAFSDVLLNNVEDIDAEDWENPQLCSDYVKDIYLYLRELEVGCPTAAPLCWGVPGCSAHPVVSPHSCSRQCARTTWTGG